MIKVLKEKWKIILVSSIVVAFCGISLFIFESTRAASVDLLEGNGSLDNTTELNLWKYVKVVTSSTRDSFQLDPNYNAIVNAGRFDVNKNLGSNANFDEYIAYTFTPTQNVSSATLDLGWLKRATPSTSGSLSSSTITAEIYRVSDGTTLPVITINTTRTLGQNYTAVNGLQVNGQLSANTAYELRLRAKGNGRNISYYFDEVVLNGVLANPPVLNSVTVVNDSTINLTFDKALDQTSAETISNYTISPFLNVKTATLQPDGVSVKLTTNQQTYGVAYTVSVNNVKSTTGDQMTTPGTKNFTGTDTTVPQLLAASSVDNNTVNLLFNEDLDSTTISNLSHYAVDNGLTISSATLFTDNRTIQLKSSSQSTLLYTIAVNNIKDIHNNTIGSVNNTASFTGTAPVDSTPPTVVSSVVLNDTTVDVKFSEAVESVSAQNATNYSINPNMAVSNAVLQSDGTTVRLTTGKQVNGTIYTLTINNVKDSADNPVAAGTTTTFTGLDTTPPSVISAKAVNDLTIDLVFSEVLDSTTANNIINYTISPNLTLNSAVLQLDEKTVRISASTQTEGTVYTITVNGVKDLANNTIGSSNSTTFTGKGPDITPPTLASVSAPDNQTLLVVFSEPVDPVTSQNPANYVVTVASLPVAGFVATDTLAVTDAVLQSDGQTVDLTTATQSPNTSYSLTINNVQDTSGNVISSTSNTSSFVGSSVTPVNSPHENFTADTDKCASCHNTHAALGSNITVTSSQTTLCYLCHDAGGQSSYDVAGEFGKPNPRTSHHKIPEGTQNCVDCHNPHGSKDANGSPVPAMLRIKSQPGVTSGNSFCLGCHQNANGTTKAIYSTYYPADGIGHNSSSLSPASGTNIRCEGCHQKHSSDSVKLLKTDPNGDTITATGDNKSFCVECHKSASSDNRYLGSSAFDNSTYSKHSLTTSINTNASYPGVTGQAGQCQNCHDPHGTAYGTSKVSMKTLRANYEDGLTNYTANNFTLCFQCHNSSGANNKYDIQTQYTDSGTTQGGHYIKTAGGNLAVGSKVPCEDCHSIHGSANNNKYLMSDSLGTNLGDGRNQCLTCHTAGKIVEGLTMANIPSIVPQHNDNTTPCLDCHGSPHQPTSGISNGGLDCNSCHSSIATAMKSTTSGYHHLIVDTSATYSTTQTNKNCLSCHVDHNKFNNSPQKAFNLKQNFNQSFLTIDNSTTGAANTDFNSADPNGGICLSCHQTKQTKTYTQSGSTETPAIGVSTFSATAHNYSVQSTFKDGSTFDAVCTKCHNDTMTKDKQTSSNKFGTHNSTYSSILSPFGDTSLVDPMNEKFCYKCHGTDNPNNATGNDYYGVAMSAKALGIQSKFTITTNLSTPSSHNLTQMTCASCHNTHNVSKRDASGNAQTATTSVYSDPSNTLNPFTTTSGDAVAFCLKCHTTGTKPTANDTATTYVPKTISFSDPSPNGFTVNGSGWYMDNFPSSTHYNNTIKKVLCTSCHDPHGSSNPLLRIYPDDTATTDGDCFVCHNGTITGVPNIKGEFQKADSHPSLSTTAGAHSITENYNLLGSTDRHAKCEDCHDPHSINDGRTTLTAATATGATSFTVADGTQFPNTNGAVILVGSGTANAELAVIFSVSGNTITVSPSLTKTHASGNVVTIAAPTRPGMLKNSSGVGVGTRTAWTSLPSNSTTYTFKKTIDNEYELCYKCHSTYSWGTTPPTATSGGLETDLAQQFNPVNSSYHPVEAATKNNWSYITGENFNTASPFRLANVGKQKMYCMDCHGDDQQQADGYTSVVKGPHGSANKYLLKKPYNSGTTSSNAQDDLCLICHSAAVYDSTNTSSTYANYTGFRNGDGDLHLQHRNSWYTSYFGGSGKYFCGDCHGLYVHGQQRPKLIVYQSDPAPYNTWSALTSWTNPGPGNYTETSCRVGPNPRTGQKCYGGH